MRSIEHRITFDKAHWRIPSVERAFDGILEGKPTDEEQKDIIEKAQRGHDDWSPSKEAWEQFEEMKKIIDHVIVVQIWDPIMFMLDDEGPYPMQSLCTGLHLIVNEEGKSQAYMSLKNVRLIKTPGGFDASSRLLASGSADESLLSFADIYEVVWGQDEIQRLVKDISGWYIAYNKRIDESRKLAVSLNVPSEVAEQAYPYKYENDIRNGGIMTARYDRYFKKPDLDAIKSTQVPKMIELIKQIQFPGDKRNPEYAFDIHIREKSKLMIYGSIPQRKAGMT